RSLPVAAGAGVGLRAGRVRAARAARAGAGYDRARRAARAAAPIEGGTSRMKLQLCTALLALAQAPEPAPAPATPEPWKDTIVAGLGEVRRCAGRGEAEDT